MRPAVRGARPADLPAVLALYRQLHLEDPALSADTVQDTWAAILGTPRRTVLLAEIDGAPVGTAEFTVVPNLTRGGRPFALVENVVVDAGHRRLGVGRLLLGHVEEACRRAGCYKIQLASGDAAADAFYQRCGYACAGHTMKKRL